MGKNILNLISSIRADLDQLEKLANDEAAADLPFADTFVSDEVDKVAQVMEEAGLEYREASLTCPCDVQAKVWDNRPQKASGEFKSNSPDFKCSNTAGECNAKNKPDNPNYHKGWWINSYDLPAEWLEDGEDNG